jgi:hypothetical protein
VIEQLAADPDASRRITLGAALARGAQASALPAAHELAGDPLATVRLLAQIALARAGDRDAGALSRRILVEDDLGVLALLAGRAGSLAISPPAVDDLAAQGALAATPPELRAGCAWAVTAHDPPRGGYLAGLVIADDEAAFHLASIVARRGGPLAPIVDGLRARPASDRIANLLAL